MTAKPMPVKSKSQAPLLRIKQRTRNRKRRVRTFLARRVAWERQMSYSCKAISKRTAENRGSFHMAVLFWAKNGVRANQAMVKTQNTGCMECLYIQRAAYERVKAIRIIWLTVYRRQPTLTLCNFMPSTTHSLIHIV